MSRKIVAVSIALVVLLTGCATQKEAAAPAVDLISRPSSELPVTSEARAASKVHVELGTAYLSSGRPGVALDEARIAVAFDKTYAPAHLLMGLVYGSLDQFDLAAPAFQEASRLAPGDPEVNNAYGWFLCSQGRETEGLQRIDQAARNPYLSNPSRAWVNAGLCLMRVKDYGGAEARLVRANQIDEANLQALALLADLGYRTERYLRAKQWIDMLIQKSPETNESILWLALRIERKLGNKDSVAGYAAKLRRDYPGSNEYQNFLQGKFE